MGTTDGTVDGDVLDIFSLEEAFEDITHVIHCAATVSFSPAKRKEMFETNIDGTKNIVNQCILSNVKLIHFSSIAALGRSQEGNLINEDTSWQDSKNNSQYAITKYLSEMAVWAGIAEGLDAIILCPSIILGPGNWKTDSSSLFAIGNKKIPFYPTGGNGFVDVDDICLITNKLLQTSIKGERFLLAGNNVKYQELFSHMCAVYDTDPPKKALPWILGQIGWRFEWLRSKILRKQPVITKETIRTTSKYYQYDSSKIEKELNFKFRPTQSSIERIGKLFLASQ